jgi:hypothetical protein
VPSIEEVGRANKLNGEVPNELDDGLVPVGPTREV